MNRRQVSNLRLRKSKWSIVSSKRHLWPSRLATGPRIVTNKVGSLLGGIICGDAALTPVVLPKLNIFLSNGRRGDRRI